MVRGIVDIKSVQHFIMPLKRRGKSGIFSAKGKRLRWFSGRGFPRQLLGCWWWVDTHWFRFYPWWTLFLWRFQGTFASFCRGFCQSCGCFQTLVQIPYRFCRHDQKIAEYLALMTFPLDCKFRIVGLQSNPSVSTAWRDSPTKNGFAWQDFQTSPWKKPCIAYNTLLGLFSDTYAGLRNFSNIRFLPMFLRVFFIGSEI